MSKLAAVIDQPMPLSAAERADCRAASREVVQSRAEGRPGLPHRRMTEARWAAFIAATREVGGNVDYAASLCDGDRAWTWAGLYRQAINNDPLREREWIGACRYWESRIHRHLFKLGVEGVEQPVYQGGEMVGVRRIYSEKVALAMASHFLKLVEKRSDVTTHADAPADDTIFSLSADSVLRMDAETREALRTVLLWVRADRAQNRGAIEAEPDDAPMIEHDDELSAEDREALEEIFS